MPENRWNEERSPSGATEPSQAELAVLDQLWSKGARTVRDLVAALYPGAGPSATATVQKLLERLGQKALVERERLGRSYVYRSAVARGELVRRQLRATADALCGGSMAPLLTHLVEADGLASEDVERLRDLIERAESRLEEER